MIARYVPIALIALAIPCGAAAQAEDRGPPPAREPTAAEMAEARHSFEVGLSAFDAGEYDAAVTEFRAAYELTHHPDLWFNIYLAEERRGQLEAAAEALDAYLRDGTIEPDERGLLERRLERIRARIAARQTQTAPPPESEEDRLEQDVIRDSAEAIGSPAPAEQEQVEDDRAPPPPPPSGPHPAGIGVTAAAGVLLVAFAVLAPLSEVEDASLASRCGRDVGRFCAPGETGTLEALNIAADASWIGAAVLGVTGIALLFALPPEGSGEASVALAPWAAPTGAGVAIGGRL